MCGVTVGFQAGGFISAACACFYTTVNSILHRKTPDTENHQNAKFLRVLCRVCVCPSVVQEGACVCMCVCVPVCMCE